MTTPILKIYPSAPLENKNDDLEQRLKNQLKVVNIFVNSITEMITFFIDRNLKSKKKYKNYKTLNSILE